MALDAAEISSLVFADHLSVFPDAVNATRENANTGVPLHIVVEAFIQGLVAGVVAALGSVAIADKGSGNDDTPGNADPVHFTMPRIAAAEQHFLTVSGWTGDAAPDVAAIFIGSTLSHIEAQGLLQMSQNQNMGTGTSVVQASTNPNLEELFKQELRKQLPLSFQATGKFGKDDVPSNPINDTLVDQLENYCEAFAVGVASITASVSYTGSGGGSSVSNVINTGSVI